MKITEDTDTRFTIVSRRKIFADLCFAFFALFGAAFTCAMLIAEITQLTAFFIVIGLLFTGIGVWGILSNSSARITFDATQRLAHVRWRGLLGAKTRTIPFDLFCNITVHEDDDMHTLQFDLAGKDPLLLDRVYSSNTATHEVAARLREWMNARGHGS
ncbi:hypothetical protein [Gymnodinialimonas sp. 57CJ19]|uniref:hypothetical protein n=1 Tax=Gymnodinialimonas sp. 57CJ19 TaxID=3138498 RepID=UPI0031344CE6